MSQTHRTPGTDSSLTRPMPRIIRPSQAKLMAVGAHTLHRKQDASAIYCNTGPGQGGSLLFSNAQLCTNQAPRISEMGSFFRSRPQETGRSQKSRRPVTTLSTSTAKLCTIRSNCLARAQSITENHPFASPPIQTAELCADLAPQMGSFFRPRPLPPTRRSKIASFRHPSQPDRTVSQAFLTAKLCTIRPNCLARAQSITENRPFASPAIPPPTGWFLHLPHRTNRPRPRFFLPVYLRQSAAAFPSRAPLSNIRRRPTGERPPPHSRGEMASFFQFPPFRPSSPAATCYLRNTSSIKESALPPRTLK
jgi:hypothetical protein